LSDDVQAIIDKTKIVMIQGLMAWWWIHARMTSCVPTYVKNSQSDETAQLETHRFFVTERYRPLPTEDTDKLLHNATEGPGAARGTPLTRRGSDSYSASDSSTDVS